MTLTVEYFVDTASEAEIARHLLDCDANFFPRLSSRVRVRDYARKIFTKATRFEAWSNGALIGLVAVYCNDRAGRSAFITNVSVGREWMRRGIVTRLMGQCVSYAETQGMRQIGLEVSSDSTAAIKLYKKIGFASGKTSGCFVTMSKEFEKGKENDRQA